MKIPLTIVLFFICNATQSQKHLVVKDADTNQPLAFATAECFDKQWGTYSDSTGRITIPDNIWDSCTITFSYVGYVATQQKISKQVAEVYLKRASDAERVTVRGCLTTKDVTIENYKKKTNNSLGWSAKGEGFIWAAFLNNTSGRPGLIKSITFYVKKFHPKAIANAPVRLRLYAFNAETGLPAEEITTESIMIAPKEFGKHTEDLSGYKMHLPMEGIVVGFEMFDAGSQYHYINHMKFTDGSEKDVEMYGWSLGSYISDDALGFRRFLGKAWIKTLTFSKKAVYAPIVSLSAEVCR